MATAQQDTFSEIILKSVGKHAAATATTIENLLSVKLVSGNSELVEHRMDTDKNFYVSIFFTGMVYGEFILATDQKTAAKLLGHDLKDKTEAQIASIREEMTETFSEILNLVVGEGIVDLNQVYKKLTITPPRVYFGSIAYPKIKMARSVLTSEHGSFDCYVYIDRMKLDIASSYKEALVSVLTAHKELQNAMKKLQDQQSLLVQSEKMAALGTMAAGVAHEINTPLSTVALVGGQIKDAVEAKAEVDRKSILEMLATIDDTIARISKITNGMKTFAHHARSDTPTPTSLNQIIENSKIVFERNLNQKAIKFHCSVPIEDLTIECRLAELSQVLINLVNNSCDAISENPVKWIRLEIADLGQMIEFKITDSGSGIPVEVEKKIFDPFFTTKDFGQGVGLGLSISKGIVDYYSGQIGFDRSASNTCFYVRLPKKFTAAKAS